MKPRIAFCFSGQARTFDFTSLYFENNVLSAASEQGFNYDIFCAVEDDGDIGKIENLKPIKVEKIKSKEVENGIIREKYGAFFRENFNSKYYFARGGGNMLVNAFQQWYKIMKADDLRLEYEKENNFQYDIVVRLRFDIIFLQKIDFQKIFKEIKEGYTLLNLVDWAGGVNDQFLFGSSEDMARYSRIFDKASELFTEGLPLGLKGCSIRWMDSYFYGFIAWLLRHAKRDIFRKILLSYIALQNSFVKSQGICVYDCEKILLLHLKSSKIRTKSCDISFILFKNNNSENATILFQKSQFTS